MVDTEGFVLKPYVTSANLADQQGLFGILDTSIDHLPNLEKIWADQSYQGEEVQRYCLDYGIELEVVSKGQGEGFQVSPKRWIVERTFAWLGKQRRLSKDYEFGLISSEAMIYLAMTRLMIRRAAYEIKTL